MSGGIVRQGTARAKQRGKCAGKARRREAVATSGLDQRRPSVTRPCYGRATGSQGKVRCGETRRGATRRMASGCEGQATVRTGWVKSRDAAAMHRQEAAGHGCARVKLCGARHGSGEAAHSVGKAAAARGNALAGQGAGKHWRSCGRQRSAKARRSEGRAVTGKARGMARRNKATARLRSVRRWAL